MKERDRLLSAHRIPGKGLAILPALFFFTQMFTDQLSERFSFIEKLLKMVSNLDLADAAEVVDQLLPLLHGHGRNASPDLFISELSHVVPLCVWPPGVCGGDKRHALTTLYQRDRVLIVGRTRAPSAD
jgi:hypothetical protein